MITSNTCNLSSSSATAAASRTVQQSWPGREKEVSLLWKHICRSRGDNVIFVHGRPGTGKTGVVRSTLAGLKKRNAYVNVVETSTERAILQLIIEQLRAPKKRDAASQSDAGSILHYDFMAEIAALFPPGKAQTAWVVLDNFQRLRASVVSLLLSLRHTSAAVSWVLISQAPLLGVLPLMSQPTDLLHRLKVLHFWPYSQTECGQVMRQWQPSEDVQAVQQLQRQLVPLAMMSRNAEDMQQDATEAYDILLDGSLAAVATSNNQIAPLANAQGGGSRKRRFPQWAAQGEPSQRHHIGAFATGLGSQSVHNLQQSRQSAAEEPELPVYSKLLIVAAYVASRTKEAMDRTNFDPSARRKRRHRGLAHDDQTEEAHLNEVRGRNLFGRERLLAIFWSLLDAHLGQQDDANVSCITFSTTTGRQQQDKAVLDHVTSLVASKALLQVPEFGTIGFKYACDMPDACAQHLARDLNLDLKTYVH